MTFTKDELSAIQLAVHLLEDDIVDEEKLNVILKKIDVMLGDTRCDCGECKFNRGEEK